MKRHPAPKRIQVITDGRPGNENPALGLAEAIAARCGAAVEARRIALRPGASWLPAGFWAAGGALAFAGVQGGRGDLGAGADLVIGAGRRSAPVIAALRGPGRRAIQFMAPQMPLSRFDAVIAPEHDRLQGPNVLTTLGSPTRLTAARVAEAAQALGPAWRGGDRRLAALIGGPSGAARFGEPEAEALIAALHRFADAGFAPLLIPSRRTPDALIGRLKTEFPAAPIHVGGGANPYPGVLGVADAALVTADSVNMCSEAASTGMPLFVLPVPGLSPKLRRFQDALAARTGARAPEEPQARWTYDPLDEAGRIAGLLLARGGEPRPA